MSIYADMPTAGPVREPMPEGHWLLIDAAVLANVVYYAERSRSKREDGFAAVEDPQPEITAPRLYDFACSLLDRFTPTHALAAWDGPRNWRKRDQTEGGVAGYKAARTEKPFGLRALLKVAPEVFAAAGVENVRLEGYEADDVIASAASGAPGAVIVSNDKDFAQCLSATTRWWNPMAKLKTDVLELPTTDRGEWVTRDTVLTKWGVEPHEFTAYQAIAGDASDSVRGCPGIGDVGAQLLVNTHGTVARILEAAERGDVGRYAPRLLAGRDSILESLRAVTLATDLNVTAAPVGDRKDIDVTAFANPFKRAATGPSVTEQLTAQTRPVEAAEADAAPDAAAEPAAEPEAPKGPPQPKRGRPAHQIPDHPAIPSAWRGVGKGQLRANTVGQCRMALAKAAVEAGHAAELTTPETRTAALVEHVARLVEVLTGARPWPAQADTEEPAEPVETLAEEPAPGVATEADRQRVATRILDVARNALATRSPAALVLSRARACNEAHKEALRLSDVEVEQLVARATAAHELDVSQRPEGHSPQRVAAARVEAEEPKAEEPKAEEPKAEEPKAPALADTARLYIDCQPLDGTALELDQWAERFAVEVCEARKVSHYLLCQYAEGPKLVATLVSRWLREGNRPPSLVVRRSGPLADACLPELRRVFSKSHTIEATR